jgi:hypothetical protein
MTYRPLVLDTIAVPEIPTFKDLVDILLMYYPNDSTKRGTELAVRAARSVYQELLGCHPWKFYNRQFAFTTSPDVAVLDVEYTALTGAFEIDADDQPSWIEDGSVVIESGDYRGEYEVIRASGDAVYVRAAQRISDDIESVNLKLVRRRYPLPLDFKSDMTVYDRKEDSQLIRLLPSEEHVQGAWDRTEADDPRGYVIRGGRSAIGKVIELTPPPPDVRTISMAYRSTGRPLATYQRLNRITGSDGSTSVTFDLSVPQSMVGTCLRANSESDETPTSVSGASPWTTQRMLVAVNGTSGTVDYPLSEALTDAPCVLSDVIDIDPSILWPVLEAWSMHKMARYLRAEDEAMFSWREVGQMLMRAKEMDNDAIYTGGLLTSGWATVDYMQYASE